ncbi:hypothetical protein BBO99_00001059 [Phytophthora kernoviae]|uniref:Acyltransferase n=1 Tax=Phytophthora kernoviae TaxID=325452 RepID=A0A3R7K2S3_9STRA|nr:hypothetical protein BBI17_001030 [Phytophthora kernoviae]RLN84755.1 hypothetical protein BBO99_00001059 [Phytophthora kernoviae]
MEQTADEVPQLTRRKPKAPPRLVLEQDEEDEAFAAVPVEQMSARGVFLLSMAVVSFAAFTLFALAELTHNHPRFLLSDVLQGETHDVAQWALLLAVPATSAAAWFPISISRATQGVLRIKSSMPPPTPDSPAPSFSPTSSLLTRLARRYRRNHMFAIYQSVGWTLYGLFVALQLACFTSDNLRALPFCRPGNRSIQAVAAFIAEVIIISSVLTLERRRDRNRQRRKDRFVVQLNNFNNMLLLVGATLLALASEYTRVFPDPSGSSVGYPMATGLGSLALFVTALFNTYGLGALQVLYLISLVVVEVELFVGAMAVAGSLFVVAQIVMMMSLLVFKKAVLSPRIADDAKHASSDVADDLVDPSISDRASSPAEKVAMTTSPLLAMQERLREFTDECLAVLVIGGLANIHVIPNAVCVLFFALTTDLGAGGVAYYGLMATGVEFIMVISRSIATHMYQKDSRNGLQKDVNRYHVKYVLPQIITGCLPAVAAYRHYIYDMEAFVPVLILTIFIYIYEFTYRGNPQQTGCRERISWVTGRSFLVDTVQKYFNGKIIRMAPLDPEKQYVLSFHPHGIMPISVMWLQFTDQWRKLFPNFYAHILTASVLHHLPLARDILHFYGSREVTRNAFAYTLQNKESVLLVPGGQAEMLEQRSAQKEVRVYTHHKGFIRLAIEHGVPLVPVLSFNEGEMMDNVQAPMMQRWFVKKLAFPFPYFPYGRGLLPIPRKVNIPIVVGEPLEVPHIPKPTQDDVDKVHTKYFAALEEIFVKYKDEVGCGDYKLVFI